MQYVLYKLKFETPVHFGTDKRGSGLEQSAFTCHADTWFSALCMEVAACGGNDEVQKIYEMVNCGELLFSDLMPYCGENLFLPKPILQPENSKIEREFTIDKVKNVASQRKKAKKITHIPVSQFVKYLQWLKTGKEYTWLRGLQEFGRAENIYKVNRREDESLPYYLNVFSFWNADSADNEDKDSIKKKEQAGLYFVAGMKDESFAEKLRNIVELLGMTGIGGKRSSGYGKFSLFEDELYMDEEGITADDALLYKMLVNKSSNWQMSLSVVCPKKEEISLLEGAKYLPIYRGGFVNSRSYSDNPVKRNSVYMLNAGSCFKTRLQGCVKDVAAGGKHPVYRYGKGLYVGFDI